MQHKKVCFISEQIQVNVGVATSKWSLYLHLVFTPLPNTECPPCLLLPIYCFSSALNKELTELQIQFKVIRNKGICVYDEHIPMEQARNGNGLGWIKPHNCFRLLVWSQRT